MNADTKALIIEGRKASAVVDNYEGKNYLIRRLTDALEAATLPSLPSDIDGLVEPTEEMVEEACRGYWPAHWPKHFAENDANSIRGHMRAALIAALRARQAPEGVVDEHNCPICDEPFKIGDQCSTDIELGMCHAECLEGSPTVNLDTGEPMEGPIPTYPYEPLDIAPCGGCGNADPEKRCINCFHDFGDGNTPKRAALSAIPIGAVKVKSMTWEDWPSDGSVLREGLNDKRRFLERTVTPWETYVFLMLHEDDETYWLDGIADLEEQSFSAPELAREAADTFVAARILSALEGQPS